MIRYVIIASVVAWLTLQATSAAASSVADLDGNGAVELNDYAVMSAGFSGPLCEPSGAPADLNADGCVDLADFAILQNEFAPAAVPACPPGEINADGVLDCEVELVLDLDGDGIPDVLAERVGFAQFQLDNVDNGTFPVGPDGFRDAGLREPDIPNDALCPDGYQCLDVEFGNRAARSAVNTGKLTVVYLPDSDGFIDENDVEGTDNSLLYVGMDVFNGNPRRVPEEGSGTAGIDYHDIDFGDSVPLGDICDDGVADFDGDGIADYFAVPFDVDGDGNPQNIGRWNVLPECTPPTLLSDTDPESYNLLLYACSDLAILFLDGGRSALPPGGRTASMNEFVGELILKVGRNRTEIELVADFAEAAVPRPWVESFPDPGEPGIDDTLSDYVTDLPALGPRDVEFLIHHLDTVVDRASPTTAYEVDRLRLANGGIATFSDSDGDSAAEDRIFVDWLVELPQIETTKHVRCPGDDLWHESVQALQGSSVEFQIQIENTGNLPLAVTLTDVLDSFGEAGVTLDPTSLEATLFRPADGTGVAIDVDNASEFGLDPLFFSPGPLGFLESIEAGEPAHLGTIEPVEVCAEAAILGDRIELVFRANVDAGEGFCDTPPGSIDVRNAIAVVGESDGSSRVDGDSVSDVDGVIDTPRERAQGFDDNVATVDLLCRRIQMTKEVRLWPNGEFTTGEDALVIAGASFPADLEYRYTVGNLGETAEEIDLVDAFLCDDVTSTDGVAVVGGACPLCETPLPGHLTEVIPAGAASSYTCRIRFETPDAVTAFTANDDDRPECSADLGENPAEPGCPGCYRNCAQVHANATNLEGICHDLPPEQQAESFATICEAGEPPVCDAGGPYDQECAGAVTAVALDATGSSDPNDNMLAFEWDTDCPGGVFDDHTSATATLAVDSAPGCSLTCTVNLTVTSCGQTDTCSAAVTISDSAPPEVTCPSDLVVECSEPTAPENTGTATAVDLCDQAPTCDHADVSAGTCPTIITRTWTCTDDCAQSNSCTQIITVEDTTAPDITCPPDVTIECGESTHPDDTGGATATDNCSESLICTYADVSSGACPEVITRTWTCRDECDNASSCSQTITVDDTGAPQITCPPEITIECDESTDPADTGSATAIDDCDPAPTCSFTDSSSGVCPTVVIRTWTCRDECDNASTCEQTILLDDTTPPDPTCPPGVTIDCNESADPTATGVATAVDNCDAEPGCVYAEVSSGTCPELITRTWTCTDICDNADSCDQVITIEDSAPPQVTCPQDMAVECDAPIDPDHVGTPTAVDDCDEAPTCTYTETTSGTCPTIVTRTWTCADECENAGWCDQLISLDDTTPPLIGCPPDLTVAAGASVDPAITGMATATDNCGSATLQYTDVVEGECPTIVRRTWTATDQCGLTSTCVQTIYIPCGGDIPTVSEWGLVVMALLLLVVSKIYFGGRGPAGVEEVR